MRPLAGHVRAALALLLAVLALCAPAAQRGTYRAGIDLVNVSVVVTDRRGALVTTLTADDFELLEDGRPQTLQYFSASGGPAPDLHLGLLLDVSESMAEDIAFTRTASIRFLNTLTEARDVTLVDFDTEVRAARFSPAEFPRLVERIRSQKPRGQTALFDAVGLYLDGAAGQEGRKVMVLYTDGGDTTSSLRLTELLDLVKASDATIYAIGVTPALALRARVEQQAVLRQITGASGGQVFFPPGAEDLDKVYAQVASEIRAQYTLGYVSTNDRADGSWRKISIRLAGPAARDLRVRARQGYYAPFRRP
jgi:Ca-activated chloride channel family protein